MTSHAQSEDLSELRREIEKLRAEVAELKSEREKSSEEVYEAAKAKAQEQDFKLLAGISDSGKVFFKSEDGKFTMNLSGQIQFRYIYNNLDNTTARSSSLSGFQHRRVKFGLSGKMFGDWGYKLVLATNRGTGPGGGNVFAEDVYITYKYDDNWSFLAGTNKLPFARQEIISSTRQVAVDRGLSTEFFTLNRSDQFTVNYKNGDYKAAIALSDGGNADFTGFAADASNDFAITARTDMMLIGEDWDEAKHEFAGVDSDALFLGAAVHYEVAEGGGAPPVADAGLAWTVDAVYKTGDVALSAAVFGNHTENIGAADTDQYGGYLQGDYKLDSEKDIFFRWEYIDDDDVAAAGTDPLQALTFGLNHHFNKKVKLTSDVVWIYEGDNPAADGNFLNGGELSSGLGLSGTGFGAGTGHGDQLAFRMQLQLLY